MAMALYLWDVMYNVSLRKSNDDNLVIWILGTVIVFLGGFVASLLINDNLWGWSLFGVAWLSLTALKFVTTEDEKSTPYMISED